MPTMLPADLFRSFHRAPRAQFFANRLLVNEWVIHGVTDTGEVFNVPDWPERLCGLLACRSPDKRVRYSDYLRPTYINGLPAVVVLCSLEQDDPASFAFVKKFVTENKLRNRPGRTGGITGEYPVLRQEFGRYIKS